MGNQLEFIQFITGCIQSIFTAASSYVHINKIKVDFIYQTILTMSEHHVITKSLNNLILFLQLSRVWVGAGLINKHRSLIG